MKKYLILAVLLIALPDVIYADLSFTPSDNDLSVNYLRAIFGNMEGVLHS